MAVWLQFYRDVKDWWLFGFYFCVPLTCSVVFYGLMTCELLRHQRGSLRMSLSEHLKQVGALVLKLQNISRVPLETPAESQMFVCSAQRSGQNCFLPGSHLRSVLVSSASKSTAEENFLQFP